MNKQETIKYLTDLMATVQMAYFKGRMEGHPLLVHECDEDGAAVSVDLYHFCGDGEPVCEGLRPCDVTGADGGTAALEVFCMCYDPDGEHPLKFLTEDPETADCSDAAPEQLPEETLKNIVAWLRTEMQRKPAVKEYHGGDEVYSRKHGRNVRILLAHRTGVTLDYYMTVDGLKVMPEEAEDRH